MTSIHRSIFLALLTLAALACNKGNAPAAGNTSTGTGSANLSPSDLPASTVVATVAGKNITLGELDKKLENELADLQETYRQQRFQLRRQGLERMVLEQLVRAEALKKGFADKPAEGDQPAMTAEDQFLKAEVEDKAGEPTEEELQAVYQRFQSQMPPGTTMEQVRPQLVQAAQNQKRQEIANALFERLKKEANVQVKLEEPRREVAAVGPSRGPENAPVTIVEFSDFQCPFCSRAVETVDKVMETYPGKVRLVFRQFPLDFHPQAQKAAEASLCAADQGKFWEVHDLMFQNQQQLQADQLKGYAKTAGLDVEKFNKCLDSGEKAAKVQEDLQAGKAAGVRGTPAFFINGVFLNGAVPLEEFKKVIDQELASKG